MKGAREDYPSCFLPTPPCNVTAVESCNSSGSAGDNRFEGTIVPYGFSGGDVHLTGELCVPVIYTSLM